MQEKLKPFSKEARYYITNPLRYKCDECKKKYKQYPEKRFNKLCK